MKLFAAALVLAIGSEGKAPKLSSFELAKLRNLQSKDPPTVTHEICSRAIDRLLDNNIDPNEVLRANTGTWVDSTFGFPDAIFWEDMRPKDPSDD